MTNQPDYPVLPEMKLLSPPQHPAAIQADEPPLNQIGYDQERNPGFRNPRFWTHDKIVAAIPAAHGVVNEIARALGEAYGKPCAASTIRLAFYIWPDLAQMAREARAQVIEVSAFGILDRAMNGFPDDQRFVVRTLGKHDGWTTGKEVTGAGGGPVQVSSGEFTRAELEAMTNEELQAVMIAERVKNELRSGRLLTGHDMGATPS